MTNITKAAQQALEALESLVHNTTYDGRYSDAIIHLRAALQDKAWEVRQFRRVGCADWYDGNPDHEDGRGPYEARTLYAAQPAPVVPEMSSIAIRKLGGLQDRGWQINGYAIRRGNERGFVDASGFVGWWRGEHDTVAPDGFAIVPVEPTIGMLIAGMEHRISEEQPTHEHAVWSAMIAASQQKGGQHG